MANVVAVLGTACHCLTTASTMPSPTAFLLLGNLLALRVYAAPPPSVGTITFLRDAARSEGAVCLDGSPSAYYTAPGTEEGKVYIHAEGGGWCAPGLNCLQRASSPLGSSTSYPPTMTFQGGYLSNDPTQNPLMHSWTKVYLKYCDGSSQTSNLEAPSPVGNSTIFYRGHRILLAMQAQLKATVLAAATDVVISGCSAGGLSTFLHADEWRAALPPSTRVTALPDSGYFLNHNETTNGGYGGLMRLIVREMNSTLPAACIAANSGDPAACIFAETVAATLATPTFALQGKYDAWQVGPGDAGLSVNDTAGVNAWGALLSSRMRATLLMQPQHGAFLDSCFHHCGGFDAFLVDGFTQATAHAAWYGGGARRLFNQSEAYPCAACCTGS